MRPPSPPSLLVPTDPKGGHRRASGLYVPGQTPTADLDTATAPEQPTAPPARPDRRTRRTLQRALDQAAGEPAGTAPKATGARRPAGYDGRRPPVRVLRAVARAKEQRRP